MSDTARRLAQLEATEARLRQEVEEYASLTGRLARLLTGVADALNGEAPELVLWDWSNLPALAKQTKQDLAAFAKLTPHPFQPSKADRFVCRLCAVPGGAVGYEHYHEVKP